MGTMVQWYNSKMVQWYNGTLVHWYINGTMVQWYFGKESKVKVFEHTSICGGVVGSGIKLIETWLL